MIDIEYMDTKSEGFSSPYREILRDTYRYKFSDRKFDLIVTTDDNALELVRENHESLFMNAPVIFVGVNNFSIETEIDRSRIAGIFETEAAHETVGAILRLLPDTKRILLIYDDTETGKFRYESMAKLVRDFPSVAFEHVGDSGTIEDLKKRLGDASPGTAAILGSYYHDSTGRFFELEESTRALSAASAAPLFTLHFQVMQYGAVGGKVLGGRQQGRKAVEIALKILRGQSPATIQLLGESVTEYHFDFPQLRRYGIDEARLPKGSIVHNRPVSFFAKHETVLLTGGAIIAFLTSATGYLLVSNARRRKAQDLFEMLFNTVNVGIYQVNKKGEITIINEKARQLLHLEKAPDGDVKEWISERLLYREDGTPVKPEERPIYRAMDKGEVVTDELYKVRLPGVDKARRYRISASSHVNPSTNQIEYGLSTFHDVTESKEAEQRLRRSEKMEALGKVIAGLAHDFNNALAIVRANLELMEMPRDRTRFPAKEIGACDKAVDRCVNLTRRLPTFARNKDDGAAENAAKVIDLNDYMRDVKGFLRKSLTPDIEIVPNLCEAPLKVRVDPDDLENALINLVMNARDAMNGKGRLGVATRIAPPGPARSDFRGACGVRHGKRDSAAGDQPDLRTLLFDQARRSGHGARPQHGLRFRQEIERPHSRGLRTGARRDLPHLPAPGPGRPRRGVRRGA